ncbi:MAG: hypothetical protein HY043_19535 [Verrucomicrobia bacterium]|nr:hypothetical protein [Verrucomicrobiota bacterium]
MNLEPVRERIANGFKPFAIELSSGKRVPVRHPEFVMVGKGTVLIMDEHDAVTRIDGLHIAAIEDLPLSKRHK